MGTINHFSHAHGLTAVAPNASLRCSFCKRSKCTSKRVYACYPCKYFLGYLCAKLEEKTNVPDHKQHPLTLAQAPATSRSCRACGGGISGLRYSCSCNYDLHALCTLWPRTITLSGHEHPLHLDFPAGRDETSCNRCTKGDRGRWGYACTTCSYGFYLHLGCAAVTDPSNDLADLLDQLLDVIETVVDVANIWDQTQLVPPNPPTAPQAAPANEANTTSGDEDCCGDDDDCDCDDDDCDDCDCGDDDCTELSQCLVECCCC